MLEMGHFCIQITTLIYLLIFSPPNNFSVFSPKRQPNIGNSHLGLINQTLIRLGPIAE